MILYLAKFMLCSGLLYLAYLLLFEKERMNKFKRFYLLFSLALSFLIPLITFEGKTELVPVEAIYNYEPTEISAISNQTTASSPKPEEKPLSVAYLVYGAYIGITTLLLARFIKNMASLAIKVKNGKKTVWHGVTLILNAKENAAYSFMNYIFVSQADYENNNIHEGILQHELAHVKQKHSIDVVLMELLQIFLWFNPMLYFYRKAMQINHEYLADENVIQHHQSINTYQIVLINYISTQSGLSLTSQFNYLTIKKRLAMMSKTNSLKVALGKQLLLLPILAFAVFLFSTETIAQEVKNKTPKEAQKQVGSNETKDRITLFDVRLQENGKDILLNRSKLSYPPTKEGLSESELQEYNSLVNNYQNLRKESPKNVKVSQLNVDRLEVLYRKMNKLQQDNAHILFWRPLRPMQKTIPSEKQLTLWQDSKMYGVWIDGKRIENKNLANYSASDFSHWSSSRLSKTAVNYGKHYFQVDLMTKSNYQEYYENAIKSPKSMMVIRQGKSAAK
jgi:bla regulator protein BlaR1